MSFIEQPGQRLDLHEYLAALDELPGWFDDLDALLFRCFDRIQRESGVKGDLLEIGAYQGKSAVLLGYFVRRGERLVVCDLFDSPPPSLSNAKERKGYYDDVSRETFERTFLRFHERLPEVVQCSSTELPERADLRRSFRLIHVDGSHLYEIVRKDIATARALIIEDGVIVFDDYRTLHTPGVAAALWEAVAAGDLRPICISMQKMYTCTGEIRPAVRAGLDELIRAHSELSMEIHSLLGTELAQICPSGSTVPRAKQIYWGLVAAVRRVRRQVKRRLFS